MSHVGRGKGGKGLGGPSPAPVPVVEELPAACCTFQTEGHKRFGQPFYACSDCDLSSASRTKGCCEACYKVCHVSCSNKSKKYLGFLVESCKCGQGFGKQKCTYTQKGGRKGTSGATETPTVQTACPTFDMSILTFALPPRDEEMCHLFNNKSAFPDRALKMEGQFIFVHRAIVGAKSKLFKEFFTKIQNEGPAGMETEEGVPVIHVDESLAPGLSYDLLFQIVEYCYKRAFSKAHLFVDHLDVLEAFQLSGFYLATLERDLCEYVLDDSVPLSTVINLYEKASNSTKLVNVTRCCSNIILLCNPDPAPLKDLDRKAIDHMISESLKILPAAQPAAKPAEDVDSKPTASRRVVSRSRRLR